MYLTISKREINSIIEDHLGNQAFAAALAKAGESPADLTCLVAQYIQFNSIFGAGVAHLAGHIAARQDIFRDESEAIYALSDRSYEVSAEIFFAAIDEFGRKKTHRAMAQDTLRGFLEFFNMTRAEANFRCLTNDETCMAINAVSDGYRINRESTDADLFSAIGFHIGSELLADQEYNILDRFLNCEYPALVEFLEQARAYSWVKLHTTVEADHCEAALECANSALGYYTGDVSKAYGQILGGLKRFVKVQARFMSSLAAIGCGHGQEESIDSQTV